MKACFITLFALALGVAGCGSRDATDPSGTPRPDGSTTFTDGSASVADGSASVTDASNSFPIGTYTNCAQGAGTPSGNAFLSGGGFQSGAVLTLTQSGPTVNATYVDQNGLTQSVGFSTTTSTSATLAQPGQVNAGINGLCAMGVGVMNEGFYPASMTTRAGALVYNAGMVFITLTGGLEVEAGSCGTLSAPATFWILCEDREGGALPVTDRASPPVTPLPAGPYACNSQVETLEHLNGISYFSSGGGTGMLTLSQNGAKVSAQYAGDSFLAGTLSLGLTTAATANAEAGQSLTASCMAPAGGTQPSEPLSIAAGALSIHESTLFLSFAGTIAAGSSCSGAQVAGNVICSM